MAKGYLSILKVLRLMAPAWVALFFIPVRIHAEDMASNLAWYESDTFSGQGDPLDADGDGSISKGEYLAARANRLYRFDVNQDQRLSKNEFYDMYYPPEMSFRDLGLFKRIDLNGDGFVDRQENETEAEAWFQYIDKDRNDLVQIPKTEKIHK